MTERKPQNFVDIVLEHMPFRGKADEIAFQSHGVLTLGVEVELQIVDPASFNLVSKAEALLKAGSHVPALKPEIYQNIVEVNTVKCNDVHEIKQDLVSSYKALHALGDKEGVCFAGTGCHPTAHYADSLLTDTERYRELIDRNQWLIRRLMIYGMHVHIGMKSGDDFIRFNNFFLHILPHLMALSASSPFWQGEDTGLAACRPSAYEALPTAGQPYQVRNWREFEYLYHTLKKCDSIRSLKDLWWDMRPSPGYGTLEIRVCDGPATLDEAVAIAAYIHLLAHWFNDNADWIESVPPPPRWLARENKWRAMRHGLEARMVSNVEGDTKPIREDIEGWLKKLSPYENSLGYGPYIATLREVLAKGNSSQRQREVFARTRSFAEVTRHNVEEFQKGSPLWQEKVEAKKASV